MSNANGVKTFHVRGPLLPYGRSGSSLRFNQLTSSLQLRRTRPSGKQGLAIRQGPQVTGHGLAFEGNGKTKRQGLAALSLLGGSGKLLVAFMMGGCRTYVVWAPMERRCTRGPLATTSPCVRTGSSCRRLSFFRARLRENSQGCRPSCGHATDVDRQVHFSYRSSM